MSKKMHVIILAAGKGSRLAGVMPPYFKPLMTINGECLLVRTLRQVHDVFQGASYDVTVVAAPENALPICQVLNDAEMDADIIVQRQPAGPGAAVLRALNDSQTSLVLMGDNLMNRQAIVDVASAVGSGSKAAVGGRLSESTSESSTRQRVGTGLWVEKEPVSELDKLSFSWIGPVCARTRDLRDALLMQAAVNGELPIGPSFNILKPECVEVECTDIGVIQT